ncbi:MAG: xanthine dehydrogenase family protein molybdopterin-binding subunit [Proteobacteria bacterium]|nr:xanthine dehydrogenase family protein molybdopterin-binding subunit [Pseudomonadota bacterium]
MEKFKIKRRTFLKSSTLAGTGFAIGIAFEPLKSFAAKSETSVTATKGADLGLWIRISSDGTITLIAPSSEMGQGVNTALSMIIAEEMEADWQSIKTETTPANSDYKNPEQPLQITGASSSIKGFWEPLREVGAAAREMLKTSAAQIWEVPASQCNAHSGKIIHQKSGREFSFGELAEAAGKLDIPSDPPLKSPVDYKLVGRSIPRLDLPDKVTGSAKFGIDVRISGMLFATVRQSPIFEGEVLSYDETAAKEVRGVKAVVRVPNGIAVVADNTWRAKKGMEALNPKFHGGKTAGEPSNAGLDSLQVRQQLRSALDVEGKTEIDSKHSAAGLPFLDLEYEVPFLAHATLEPMNCTAHVQNDFCEIWVPTQNQEKSLDVVKEITDLDNDQIRINTTLLGGGFGRRLETDFVTQAVTISKLLQKPVQVIWMREEDMQHDYYRPASMSRFQISLGPDGFPQNWKNQLAGPSILKRYFAPLGWLGFDPTSTEGAEELPYSIPDFDFDYSLVDPGVPVGF